MAWDSLHSLRGIDWMLSQLLMTEIKKKKCNSLNLSASHFFLVTDFNQDKKEIQEHFLSKGKFFMISVCTFWTSLWLEKTFELVLIEYSILLIITNMSWHGIMSAIWSNLKCHLPGILYIPVIVWEEVYGSLWIFKIIETPYTTSNFSLDKITNGGLQFWTEFFISVSLWRRQ